MWDVIWYLGFPMFAVSVFGAPYQKHYEYDRENADQYDVIYDERQNGTENYKLNIDGLSLVWTSNSLLAAAALLEPALYGEYPETHVDVVLGPDNSKPDEQPQTEEKPSESKPPVEQPDIKPSEPAGPTIFVVDGKPENPDNSITGPKRMLQVIPGLLRSFLRKRSSLSPLPGN